MKKRNIIATADIEILLCQLEMGKYAVYVTVVVRVERADNCGI
jgi:hypothetical protein